MEPVRHHPARADRVIAMPGATGIPCEVPDDPLFVGAIAKCFAVLSAFDRDGPVKSIAELSRETGLGRSTVQRVVHTLCTLGYADRSGANRRVVLARGARLLAATMAEAASAASPAFPVLQQVARRFGETVSLNLLDGHQIVVAEAIPCSQPLGAMVPAGARFPAFATTSGRVLLASLADQELALRLALRGHPDGGDSEMRGRIRADFARIRAEGYSLLEPPRFAGGLSVAVPVHDRERGVIAALAASCPTARWTPEHALQGIVPALQSAAGELSAMADHLLQARVA